jgi:hypothetical protein
MKSDVTSCHYGETVLLSAAGNGYVPSISIGFCVARAVYQLGWGQSRNSGRLVGVMNASRELGPIPTFVSGSAK